jgi:hypothetical protein
MLTQSTSGSPGLGKTLTTQAAAEQLQHLLYSVCHPVLSIYPCWFCWWQVSARELLHDTGVLEDWLLYVFIVVHHWNTLLLLDRADVFLETRMEHNHFMNGIVAVFLRMLEWFEGVLFLTTNRASKFAILSRIHIIVEYPELKQDQRMGIWRSSLDRAPTLKGPPCLSNDQQHCICGSRLSNC